MSSCNMLKRSRYNSVLSRSFVSNKLVFTKPSYLPDISDEDLLAIGEAWDAQTLGAGTEVNGDAMSIVEGLMQKYI